MAALSPITITATVPDLWDKAVEALKERDKQNVDFQRADKRAILVDVLSEVQTKKQACIDRRLKYKRSNGDFVHLYDVFEKIMKWVNTFKEVGDAAMQYDPGHAALPWAAIRFLLQVSVNDVQIFGSMVEGLEVVCKTVARYAAIEKLYFRQPSSVDSMLEDSFIATYASILRFLSKCRRHFDLGLARRVARGITQLPETSVNKHLDRIAENDKRVSELTRIVDAERSQLTRTQQVSAGDGIDHLVRDLGELRMESTDSASKLEALLTYFKEPIIRTMNLVSNLSEILVERSRNESQLKEERLAILKWLSDVQYKKHHQTLSKGLLEGTGSWLLNKPQFLKWRDSSVSSVLWLHGIPGSGKTCLVATVVQQLSNRDFDLNTAEAQRSDPAEVLRAILKQIVCCKAGWESESPTANAFTRRREEADKDGSDVERLDISETIEKIIDALGEMPVTIIIDALDECRSDQRHQLLRALDVLLEESAHLVKVFVSSRDDVDIVLRLQKHPNIYIKIDDNKDDIEKFIQLEIQKAQSDRRMLKGTVSPELTRLITETLARKAGGMFLWVSLQIESLCDSRRIKIEGDLVDELARLPQSLAEMYSLILENIGQIEQRGRTVAKTMFRWLLCTDDAGSDVTIAACSRTMSTEYQSLSIPDILDVCSTLVIYDEALDSFRFSHLSVQEFLESRPGYTPSEANRYILERSLQTVVCNQPSGDPFWSYATLHWIFHYHRLEEQHRKEVFELYVDSFLSNGAESSDVFKIWATHAHRLNLVAVLCLKSIRSPVNNFGVQIQDLYTHEFRGPVDLASYFGWLEILNHFLDNLSPDDIEGPAMKMMTVAIRFGRSSVVRWLGDRYIYPTDEHLELAFNSYESEIVQTVSDMYVLSLNTLLNGQKFSVPTVRFDFGDIYRDLIRKGANVNCRDQDGHTALSHAALNSSNDSAIIEYLLLKGVDPIRQHNAGRTPISLLIWGEHQPTCYSLVRVRLCKTSGTRDVIKDAMRRALQFYHYHNACLLLHYGLDSMLDDVDMRAEWTGILQLIATLPDLQSDASALVTKRSGKLAKDPKDQMHLAGQTLLCLAALFRHEKAFQVLLDWGVDPTCPAICESRKKTSIAAQTGHSMSGQEPLDTNSERDSEKMSDELRQGPLAWAAFTGNVSLVQSILDRGLDPNIKNRKGQTALYFAVQQTEDKYSRIDLEVDKEAIVRLLLQHGALLTSADAYSGTTLLAFAFKARYSKVANLLIENNAELPTNNTDGSMEQWRGAFDQGQEGIRRALLARTGGKRVNILNVQSSPWGFPGSGDPLDVAARLVLGGVMRFLGDAALTASGEVKKST